MNDPEQKPYTGILSTQEGACALASVLIMKLGGRVLLTPADFNMIECTQFVERFDPVKGLELWLDMPTEVRGNAQ